MNEKLHVNNDNQPNQRFRFTEKGMEILSGSATITNNILSVQSDGNVGIGSFTTADWNNYYSAPELMDVIVTDTTIEHVYKRTSLIWQGYSQPTPEVYKQVYNRFDGSMKIVQGNYVPATNESYYFLPDDEEVNPLEQA